MDMSNERRLLHCYHAKKLALLTREREATQSARNGEGGVSMTLLSHNTTQRCVVACGLHAALAQCVVVLFDILKETLLSCFES